MDTKVNFGLKIRELVERQNTTIEEEAIRLGYTRTGLTKVLEKEDVNTEILKKVCKTYRVGMGYFLTDNTSIVQHGKLNSVGENYVAYKSHNVGHVEAEQRIELLQEKIKGLEKENSLLRDMVDMLKKQIK